jgi:S1-C subfamily serine protease
VKKIASWCLLAVAAVVFAAVCGLALAHGGSVASDVSDPYWEVRVREGEAYGSGAVIDLDGEILILTCAHVVKYVDNSGDEPRAAVADKLYLLKKTGDRADRRTGKVVWVGDAEKGPDLALVRPDDPRGLVPAKRLEKVELELGEDCYYIGTGGGLHARLERSIIAGVDVPLGGQHFTRANGNGYFGNSGGPLFVRRGGDWVLAGVVEGLYTSDPRAPLVAETPQTIQKVLDAYRASKKARWCGRKWSK